MKRVLTPLAATCLLASATSLHAAPYSALYVFGDSLSDAGWLPDANGPAGATTRFTNRTGPTYQNGSGEVFGPVSPMLLGNALGLAGPGLGPANTVDGGNNWAVGGYRTDQILNAITGPGGYLQSTGGRADPNALYYLTGGGNDFLQLRVVNGPTAQAAAGRLVDSAEALQQAGARNIMVWVLPDLGLTPTFFGTPLQGQVSALGTAFNNELVSQLSTLDANVIPLNIPVYLSEIVSDPGRYGLVADRATVIGTCFNSCSNPNPIYGLNGTTPDPTRLLFNDGVHPTIAGQRLIADYAYSLLAAPGEVTLLPEMALGTLRGHQDQLRAQWLADWGAWQAVGQWHTFVNGGGQRLEYDRFGGDADGNGYSLNLGGSYRVSDAWRVGVAAGLHEQNLEAGAADSDYNLRSYIGTAFAQYQHDHWWGDLSASAGHLDYDNLKRKFAAGPATNSEKGDTDGTLWAVSGRFGYDIAQPGSQWHLSPFISADYVHIDVDGYSEKGLRSTALTFDDQTRKSKRLGAGLQGLYDLSRQTRVFGELAVEREYEDDPTELRMSLNSLPTIDFELPGHRPDDRSLRGHLGVSHRLGNGLSLRGSYSYRHADDEAQHGVNLSVSLDI
ncbi:esterase EstP [Pseudomonas sp. Marseille-QA0892]